jgi:hypothetical protein
MKKLLFLGIAGSIALASLQYGLAASDSAYTIHFKPTVGKHLHYGMDMQMSGAQAMEITASFSLVATQHKAGKYTVVTTIDSMKVPGAPADQMKKMFAGTTITQVVDEHGKILSTKATGMASQMMQGGSMGMTGEVFPSHPVHIGDSWVASTAAAGHSTQVKVKLVAVKTVGGKQFATLHLLPLTQSSPMAKTGPITLVLETATGTLHSMNLTGDMGAGGTPTKMTISVKLR